MDDCTGTYSAASSKCCTRNPEGPQAVDLVKDLKTDRMSKVLGRIEGKSLTIYVNAIASILKLIWGKTIEKWYRCMHY